MKFARQDVRIDVPGARLAGWWYRPEAPGPRPAIAMAHGFAAVKEMGLQPFAERFAAAGFSVLAYDHRNFGASGGEPRQEADPVQQARDLRHVLTWLALQPDVDAQRLGVWGSSYSAGHALLVASQDRRVRCVVAQVPTVSGHAQTQRRVPPGGWAAMHALQAEERARLARGEPPRRRAVIPVGDAEGAPAVYDAPEAVAFYRDFGARAAGWRNDVTLASLGHAAEYEPGAFIERISPTPLLMVVADQDTTTPTDLALAAFQRALEPKRLVLLAGDHFAPYERAFDAACGAAEAWFVEHLKPGH